LDFQWKKQRNRLANTEWFIINLEWGSGVLKCSNNSQIYKIIYLAL